MKPNNWQRIVLLASVIAVIAFFPSCGKETETSTNSGGDEHLDDIWDQVRAGHWVHAINLPWDMYGSTFGIAPWGYLGLASQGPSGWRCETKKGFQGCRELFWDDSEADPRLGVKIELRAQDENLAHAMTFFWFDEMANLDKNEFLNIAGKTVSCDVYFQSGAQGPQSAPNGAVLFLQDEKWNWLESEWWNIEPGQTKGLTITLDGKSAFDATKVRAIGVKVSTNDQAPSSYVYEGAFYVDNVRIPAEKNEISFTFDDGETRTEKEFKDIAGLGVKAVRLWVFADGRSGLVFDENGFITGLDDKLLADFDEAIRLARVSGLYLIPVLFDFLLGAELDYAHDEVQGIDYPIFGHSDLFTDPQKRQSLMDNAILPLFERFGKKKEIIAWELINEGEWLLKNDQSPVVIPDGKRPCEIKEGGVVTFEQMCEFFSAIKMQYPSDREGYRQLFTLGSASYQWADKWLTDCDGLTLDLLEFHLWNGSGQIDQGISLNDIIKPETEIPIVLGEINCTSDCSGMLNDAFAFQYSGAWPWAYRAKDDYSEPMLGTGCREALKNFADSHPDEVNFK